MRKRLIKQIWVWVLTVTMILGLIPAGLVYAETQQGNVYYVAATGGADTNTGAIDAPLATIYHASTLLQPGDTLIIRGGTYSDFFVINGKGDAVSAPITIKNYDGEKVIINTGNPNDSYIGYVLNSFNVDISGLTLNNQSADDWKQALLDSNSTNVKIHNCEIFNTDSGISVLGGSTNYEIYSNIFHDCGIDYAGIAIYSSTNGKIYNNAIYNSGNGMSFNGTAATTTGNQIYNNTMYNNSHDVVCSSTIPEGNIFRNNIFSSQFGNASFLTLNDFDYNCYNSTTLTDGNIAPNLSFDAFKASGKETNGLTGDPAFMDAPNKDFSLTSSSACIDKGTTSVSLSFDISGVQRTNAPDIGAYEYAAPADSQLLVTGKSPSGVSVDITAPVAITFSSAIDSSSASDKISVQDQNQNAVAGSVTVDNSTVTFTPAADLKYNTTYTVTADASLTDVNGLTLGTAYSWTFTTKGDPNGNVYYLATNGNDNNPGTIEAPFSSIIKASAKLKPGDTLVIRGGTYNGYLLILNQGSTDSKPIIVKSYQGEKAVIKNAALNTGYVAYAYNVFNLDVSGLTFTFEDAGGNSGSGFLFHQCSNIKIHNCEFHHVDCGVMARAGTTNYEIYSNIMHDCTGDYGGVLLFTSTNGKVYNNVMYNNSFGVNNYGSTTTNNQIFNNTFYNNGYDVFYRNVGGVSTGNVYRNNIFSSKLLSSSSFLTINDFDYNCYNSNNLADSIDDGLTFAQYQALGMEAHGVLGDPRFTNIDAENFKLSAGSIAIGKGTSDMAPATDILGQARKSPIDMGAYLYIPHYYVSLSGNDQNEGTEGVPFRTIAKAVQTAQQGDVVVIKGGTYDEAVTITKSDITIMNYQSEVAEITNPITITDSQNITLEGLKTHGLLTINNSVNVKVTKLDAQTIMAKGNSDGCEISANVIHGATEEGAVILYNAKNSKVFNNVITDNSNKGIYLLGSGATGNNILNNTLYNNAADLLILANTSLGNPADNTFENNIFSNGIQLGSIDFTTNQVFDYNCYSSTALTDSVGYIAGSAQYADAITFDQFKGLGAEQHGRLGNPGFLNVRNSDYRLSQASDCRGTGTAEGAPATDITGIVRMVPFDMGAYAYTGVINTYYVATTGDDSAAGTADAPFRTIQYAVSVMRPGETLIIKGGTYNESVSINGMKGDASNYFNIKAAEGENVILSSDNSSDIAITFGQGSAFWKVEGLNIQDYSKSGVVIKENSSSIQLINIVIKNVAEAGVLVDSSSDCTLQNVRVTGGKYGASFANSTNLAVDRSYFGGASEAGLIAASSSNSRITASVIVNNKVGLLAIASSNPVIYNNSFDGNTQSDLQLDQASTGGAIKNNIFGSVNSLSSLEIMDTSSLDNDMDYNCYNKLTDSIAAVYSDNGTATNLTFADLKAKGKETNGVLGDPMYNDAANGDYSLKSGSSCQGKGIIDGNSPAAGFDGLKFLNPIDIGAFFSPYSNKVYYVSPDGNDGNDGSMENPWKTISKGMNTMRASDTLYIRGGTYNERIDVDGRNGFPKAWYTVKNYNGETVTLDTQFQQDVGIKFSGSSYWKLEGLHMKNITGAAVWTAGNSSYIDMENLEISNIDNPEFVQSGTEGILGDGGSFCIVKNCYIHDIGQTRQSQADHGIYVGYGSHSWTIDSNVIDKVPGGGIQFYSGEHDDITNNYDDIITNNIISNTKYGLILDSGTNNLISNNTFYNNWYNDVYMDKTYTNSIFQNNIFYNDIPVGTIVKVEDVANQSTMDFEVSPAIIGIYSVNDTVKGNIFRNNVICYKNFDLMVKDSNWQDHPFDEYVSTQNLNIFQNNIKADPMLINPGNGNFGLQGNSPCINTGISDKAPAVDITGLARVGIPDIGAYEIPANRNSNGNGNKKDN